MTAYNFNKRFVAPIQAGSKQQTIRPPRTRHARAGDVLQLYTAQRTKYCRLIGVAWCRRVSAIVLDFGAGTIRCDGVRLVMGRGLDRFARGDGFTDWAEMRAFWAKYHPDAVVFEGVLVQWTDFALSPRAGDNSGDDG